MEGTNSMSLKVLVIILMMLGLLVGYLLGNWFIQLVTGERPGNLHFLDEGSRVVEEEIILEDEEEESASYNYFTGSFTAQESQIQSKEVFVIQVGAFNSRRNAEELSNELSQKGFPAVIADEKIPYKVQIGAFTDRSKAEEIEKEIEALGYDAFITH
ncbi:MAG: SPOR domain-containing protein [Halanaerobiaceae bacterium]|jgi:hypothetical protein|nr:SPOR domain-containing protein [Halanaerobiaceae bacterium]